jgi:L,D-transpeptidase-like protein/putative peptidoglycan binding protein
VTLAGVAVTFFVAPAVVSPFVAGARAANGVSLEASPSRVTIGEAVALLATIEPPADGEQVTIVDEAGVTVASGATDESGAFAASFAPQTTTTLHAVWDTVESIPVTVEVVSGTEPTVRLHVGPVRLFDDLTVRGRATPAAGGGEVKVQLMRSGRVVATRNVSLGPSGRFRAALRIPQPGTYRAKVILTRPGVPRASATSGGGSTELPGLAEGSGGVFVSLLERRLVELHYLLTGVDRAFDYRTADAVMAFRKVQRLPRTETVTPAVWRALAQPAFFVPRNRRDGFHIEIDQTRQVLVTVTDSEVQAIIHVSSGKASTPTRDGIFHVYSKLAGTSSKGLYYPSFFDGQRAIHGWPDVPNYPASHGCVRVPYWIATWIYEQADYGTPVIAYH